jgi:hypothetical protein
MPGNIWRHDWDVAMLSITLLPTLTGMCMIETHMRMREAEDIRKGEHWRGQAKVVSVTGSE